MPTTTEGQTLHSICDQCHGPITITIEPGQRWDQVEWHHASEGDDDGHPPQAELRFAIDATCPGCEWPEIGFAPERNEFVCARCLHTQTDRPED